MPNEHFKRGMTSAKLAELRHKAEKYDQMVEARDAAPFVEAFKSALETLAAFTPTEKWPQEFHAAFNHTAKSSPTGAGIYRAQNGRLKR